MGDAAVVGAGVLGLAVAQRLRDRGDNVTVFEASPYLGGMASAWDLGGVTWDRHYHVTLPSDVRTRQLLRTIGLEGDLRWRSAKSSLYAGPELGRRPLSSFRDVLRLPTLTAKDKARVAATIVAGSRQADGRPMEAMAVEEWLTRWSGRRAFVRFWRPILRAQLGDEWREASAAFIWATIQRRLYSAHRGRVKAQQLGYVPGGYGRIVDGYAAWLADSGVKINAGAPVRCIRPTAEGLEVQLDDASATFDRVVVTTAAPVAADLCLGLTDAEQQRLRAVRYVAVLCASVLLPAPLSPYYLTYLTDPSSPFDAVVEMTALIDPAEVGGHSLIYLPRYASPDHPLLAATDDVVRERFLSYLQRMNPRLKDGDVLAFKVSRTRHAFALPALEYSGLMPSTTTSIPGLQLVGSANVPFGTMSVHDRLGLLQELR